MLTKRIKGLSVLLLKDGREGTVVYVPEDQSGFLADFGTEDTMMDKVTPDQIEKVLWEPPQ